MSINPFVLDEICAFLTSTDQTNDEQIGEHSKEYAKACESANERLERCELFLVSGHRTQAIRFAENEPSLKKVVERLRLKGMLDIWEEAIGTYGWTRFQPLKSDVLNLLEEAYDKENEIKDVLHEYRVSSLAKAPLSDRLLIVRQLSIMDSTNPIWPEDIDMLEKSLMGECENNGREALDSNNMDELFRLIQQHDEHNWVTEFPPSYVSFLRQVVPLVYQEFTIPKKVREFKKVLKNKDIDGLFRIRSEINELAAKAKTFDDDFSWKPEALDDFQRISDQLDKYENATKSQEFNHDLMILRSMLGGKHNKEQIEEAFATASRHGIPVPPLVQAEVEACISGMKDTKILTTIAITSLIFVVVVLAVLAVLMWEKLKGGGLNATARKHLVREIRWQNTRPF